MTTAGEGGMVMTNDPRALESMLGVQGPRQELGCGLRSASTRPASAGCTKLRHQLAHDRAAGRDRPRQLRKLPAWLAARRRNAALLNELLADVDCLRVPRPPLEVDHAYYKYYAFLRPDHLRPGWNRDRIVAEVTAKGVPCFSGSCPEIYDEKVFTRAGLQPPSRLPVARELGATSLMLLVDHTLDEGAIRRTAAALRQVLAAATR